MNFGGWVPLKGPSVDPRWIAVRDGRVPAIPGLTAIHDIHIWVRRHIMYERDLIDKWAQPFETFGWRKGDCEDISILERALLIAAGYSSDQIWMVIVYDLVTHDIHAMLVMDKFLIDSRTDRITYVAKAKDYQPIIAFSDDRAVTFGRRL